MTLEEKKERLEEKFIGKKCRKIGFLGGSETIGSGKSAITRIVSGQEFKKVVGIEIYGQPSAWTWGAKLVFEDGSISGLFERMTDIEIQEAKQ